MSQYTRYLVCYDIQDSKVRRRFFSFLKDLGLVPLQESVFYGDLKPAEARSLGIRAAEMLDSSTSLALSCFSKSSTDKCFWFPCSLDVDRMRTCVGYKHFVYEDPDGYGFL